MIRYIGKDRATYSKLSVSVLVISEDKKKSDWNSWKKSVFGNWINTTTLTYTGIHRINISNLIKIDYQ